MKQTSLRLVTGFTVLAIGVGALLGALNIIPFWSIFATWWPVLLILAGLTVIVSDLRKNYIWGLAMIIIGGFLLFKNHEIIEFSIFAVIAPVIIIAIGLSILINSSGRAKIPTGTKDSDDIVAIFSGSEAKNKSNNYKGGKITAVFGGASVDLRDATLKGEAVLDIFTLCGGVELKVPRDWHVVVKATPIAGGVENKAEGSDGDKSPTLVITGIIALGGVEIKT